MISQKLKRIKRVKNLWTISALAAASLILGVAGVPAIASAGSVSTTASCTIYGVPKIVASGLGVTPTIAVTNTGNTAFTTTVNVTESLVSKNGSKGGGAGQLVTVPANQSFEFKGGTLYAESGYKIKVIAKSVSPKFSCQAVAKVD
jgi:hypothetical protein